MKITELFKVPKNRVGRIVTNGAKLKAHEESTAVFLTQFGFNIEYILPTNTYKTHSPDFLVNSAIWETKSPDGSGNSTVGRQFHTASKQADRLILDLRRIKLPAEKAKRQALMRFEKSRNIKALLLITKDDKLLDVKK